MTVQTAIPVPLDRSFPTGMAGDFATMLQDSGDVDYVQFWDQPTAFVPRVSWNEANTPLAAVMKDCDSSADVFIQGAFAAAAANRIGILLSTDAIRRGPMELAQAMMTLAGGTDGQTILQLGAGEIKQTKPFGYKRSEGLARLEDVLRIWQELWAGDGPITVDGNIWKFNEGWIGAARPQKKPWFMAMGGGPKLIDIAARYADGLSTAVPSAFSTPDDLARVVTEVKTAVERYGRDPERFKIGIWAVALLQEDEMLVRRVFENQLVRFCAATQGRLNQADWRREGFEPPYPDDWHCALKSLPASMTVDEVNAVVDRCPPEMAEKLFLAVGSAKEVAGTLQEYVGAGADWISIYDAGLLVQPFENIGAALAQQMELCRLFKTQNS